MTIGLNNTLYHDILANEAHKQVTANDNRRVAVFMVMETKE